MSHYRLVALPYFSWGSLPFSLEVQDFMPFSRFPSVLYTLCPVGQAANIVMRFPNRDLYRSGFRASLHGRGPSFVQADAARRSGFHIGR